MSGLFELFIMGGFQFMSILLILFIAIFVTGCYGIFLGYFKENINLATLKNMSQLTIGMGGFAAVWGILGQGVGIYMALIAIQEAADVSPALIAGGLQVSMISPLFGMIIFLISVIFWLVLKTKYNKLSIV